MGISLLPLAGVGLLAGVALTALSTPGQRPRSFLLAAEAATLGALGIAVVTAALFALRGPGSSPLLGIGEVGFSVRVDSVSVPMMLLVGLIGWVVVRYARVYLDGERRRAFSWVGCSRRWLQCCC